MYFIGGVHTRATLRVAALVKMLHVFLRAQRSICVNAATEIHGVTISRAAARIVCVNGPLQRCITINHYRYTGGVRF